MAESHESGESNDAGRSQRAQKRSAVRNARERQALNRQNRGKQI